MKNNFTLFKLIKNFFTLKYNRILFVLLLLFSICTFGQTSQEFNTPGTFTFTVPSGVTSIKVEAWGSGAGGNAIIRRGGGGGAFAGNNSLSVVPLQTYTVEVGTGAAAGANGQESSFGTLVIAKGAVGATGGSSITSTGAIKFSGGDGGQSNGNNNGGAGGGGSGGASGAGGAGGINSGNTGGSGGTPGIAGTGTGGAAGGNGGNNNNSGAVGQFPGGGGGERGNSGGSSGGGGNGRVIITYTCSTIPITATEGFNLSTNLPSCWNKQTVTGADYLSVVGTDTDPFTTPVTTTPFEGAYMVKYNSFTAPAGNSQRLVTPPLSSLGITGGVDVEFYWSSNKTYKVGSPNPTDRIQIQYSTDAITWVSAGSTVPRFLPYDNQNWIKQTVNIPTAVNNVSKFYIGFLFISDNSLSMYMDKVTIKPTPKVILVTPSSPILCTGSSTILTASSTAGYSYTWSPSAGLSSTTGSTVTANPASTTTYTVTGVNGQITTTQTVTVSVNTVPTSVSATPITNTTCDATTDYVTMTSSGGVFANSTLLTEDFNGAMTGWSFANTSTGGTPSNSSWTQRNNEYIWRTTTFASNDNTSFLMSNSDSQNGGTTITAIVSPSVSTVGLTSINLSFYQYFRQVHATDITKVQFSINGGAWNDITQLTQTTTQGSAKNFLQTSFVLNSGNYPSVLDKKDVKLRFFYSSPNGWYWAIDNVVVTGTGKRVTWSPATGLYTNTSLSNPYTLGDNGLTVYAAPDGAQVYTPTSDVGLCSNTLNTVDIKFNNKKFSDANGNWDIAANWFPAGIPDATRCVRVPDFKISTVNILGALAKSVTVDSGGKLTISPNQALTITDAIINNAGNANFVVESDANLVQTNDLVVNTGGITVHRISPMKKNNYTYWSSPVSGQELKAFSLGTAQVRFYQYIESTNLFQTVLWTDKFTPGKGYAIMAPSTYTTTQANFDGEFKGVPTNGTKKADTSPLEFPLQLTPITPNRGFNMIGNPYPSNIDFEVLYALNSTKIYNTAYFWTNVDPNRPSSTNGNGDAYTGNAYAIYNGTGGVSSTIPVGAPNGGNAPTQFIKVGQGFIVKARPGQNGQQLIFNNSIRTTNDTHFFSKGASSDKDRYWLKLTTPAQNVNTILIGYIAGATNDFERDYDAPLMSVASDSFYSILNENKLGIQGKTYPLNTSDVVPLGTKHFEDGNYTVSLGDKEGIFANGQNIYLKDKQTGIISNLTQGSYTFAAIAGENTARFEIVYQPGTVLVTDAVSKEEIVVYRDGEDFVVKSQAKKITALEVYDAAGRLVLQLSPNQKEVRIAATAFVNGAYLLKINRNGEVSSKKILK